MMKLIGMAGKARSGKDTVADYLSGNHSFHKFAFADPLKRAASMMFGIPLSDFYDGDKKEVVNEFWGFSPRQMAQLLGTEGGRKLFREDLWLKRAEMELETIENTLGGITEGVVITDIRFENEAQFVREHGGTVVHIFRDGAPEVSAHESENGVAILDQDFVIENDGTLDDLYKQVTILMGRI